MSLAIRGLRALLAGAVFALLAAAVLDLPREPGGLTAAAMAALPESGVEHPVTAVLLNFRAYDTLVEVAVLLLAALGIQALAREADFRNVPSLPAPSAVLPALAAFVAPLALVAGVYILWLGTHAPGGAFQAGAVLAAALVLLSLSGYRSVALISAQVLRPLLAVGLVTFLIVGMAVMALGRHFLEYPAGAAGTLIVLIETAIAVSIGVILASLFVGAMPRTNEAEVEPAAPGAP
jgi:multisubunit Na+/H+ antiporter MnhB subunit